MRVFDFDKTLYCNDSTQDFIMHCLRKYPRIALTLPRTGLAAVGMATRALDKTRFKAALYRALTCVPDVPHEVELFWSTHEQGIAGACADCAQPGDLVISASPEFLLRDVCAKRGWQLIASQVDPCTGRVLGPNCSGAEKVVRFRGAFPDAHVEAFYSDSRNDDPMAALADEAWLVKDGALIPWPK